MTSGNQTHKFIDFDFVGLRPGSSFTPVRQLMEAKSLQGARRSQNQFTTP